MRLLRLVLAAALCLATASVAAASPGQPPVHVPSRTYQLTMILSGSYHEETHFRSIDEDGFCPATGQAMDAAFHVVGTARLKVKLDTTASRHRQLDVNDIGDNDWTIDLTTVSAGDACDQLKNFTCSGISKVAPNGPAENFAYAQGAGHKIYFGTELTGAPTLQDQPSDCQQDQDYYPNASFGGLSGALAPYVSASMGVTLTALEQLKTGHSISRSFKPLRDNTPDGYDVATCNDDGNPTCTGALSGFTHTITIKRIS